MPKKRWGLLLISGLLIASTASAAKAVEEDEERKEWQEIEVPLPPPPREQDLIPFYVTATTDNRFFVDSASLAVGEDGVVRYSLLVLTPAGGRNLSFEGMRCETRELRLYAFGRPDGAWSKSRSNRWERMQNVATNRHHVELFREFFCPGGVIVRNAEEARSALRRGGHPSPVSW